MSTTREELHALVDRAPEDSLEALVALVRRQIESSAQRFPENWHDEMRQLRERIYSTYGKLPSVVDTIHEMREERLNDILGGR